MSNHANPPPASSVGLLPVLHEATLAAISPDLMNASLVPIADGRLPPAHTVNYVFVIAGVPGSGHSAIVNRTFGRRWPDGFYSISGTKDLAYITSTPALAYQHLQSFAQAKSMILTEIAVRPLADAQRDALANNEVPDLKTFEDCCENHKSGFVYLGGISYCSLITNVLAGDRPLALISAGRVTYVSDDAHQDGDFQFVTDNPILIPSIPAVSSHQLGVTDDPDVPDTPRSKSKSRSAKPKTA